MTMLQIVTKTKSLGRKVEGSDDDWRWSDDGGASVVLHFERGRLARWRLERAPRQPRRPAPATRPPRISRPDAQRWSAPCRWPTATARSGWTATLVDWRDAKIHVLTHTLHYGCGAFEGVRAYNTVNGTAIFRLRRAHRAALQQRQDPAHEDPVHASTQVVEAQRAVVRENKLESLLPAAADLDRLREARRLARRATPIHLMVAAWPWGAYLGEEGLKRGIRVKTSSYTRHHVNITMTQAKAVSNYTNSILANMEALDDGYDEALLLDASGFVSEGAGENLFMIKKGVVYTPDLSAGALERHHPQHHPRDLRRPRPEAGREAHHARRGLHLRRGVLHRHRRRGDADPRARPHRARRRLARADHREDPERVLRHRQRPQSEVRRVADRGLTRHGQRRIAEPRSS